MGVLTASQILNARKDLVAYLPSFPRSSEAAEGGCGVLGLAVNVPIPGRHVLAASQQMHNRGNGKGGGIAMAGLDPAQLRVSADTLRTHYLIQIALLDPGARGEVERNFIEPDFEVAQAYEIQRLPDYRSLPGLEVRPPDVWRYFARPKPESLARFAEQKGLTALRPRSVEDEFVYQNSFRLNVQFYASLGEKRAFVLCHGRNLVVLKIVGYAEQVLDYYDLHDQTARVWISHQRYPTKGRVWHPGGAHPFVGLNEALVHNGDFANYHSVCEYLHQHNIAQLFLTDTEVGVQLFDLWDRVRGYPLEVTLEAMAPTTEHDFQVLPREKQDLYRAVQAAHIHGSPDGPWFFILARSLADEGRCELIGITDTSMLRPQVFALYENDLAQGGAVRIGLIASERQAINACLRSLAANDPRFQPIADRYWVARGGSHTDGGAFRLSVTDDGSLTCTDKFGREVPSAEGTLHIDRRTLDPDRASDSFRKDWAREAMQVCGNGAADRLGSWLAAVLPSASWDDVSWGLRRLECFAGDGDDEWWRAHAVLTFLRDRPLDLGSKRRSSLLGETDGRIRDIFDLLPLPQEQHQKLQRGVRLTWEARHSLRPPEGAETFLVIDTLGFAAQGQESAARWLVLAHQAGWRHLIAYNWRGGRFAACGLGPRSAGVRIDLYGDVGDYAGSGLDGAEVHLHGDGQDQVGQIVKSGTLVIHGDTGQTFLYGAKGGTIFVRGSAAGRPLINATGRPRAVINGTCLDYLAESFMAGDPLQGGGFVILNGVNLDDHGHLRELESPYPGGNLFSLASGGAIYLRDPHHKVEDDQLNGGAFVPLSEADWELIEPYLQENEAHFGIARNDLLNVDGVPRQPQEVYRKVEVRGEGVLMEEE